MDRLLEALRIARPDLGETELKMWFITMSEADWHELRNAILRRAAEGDAPLILFGQERR